MLLLKYFALVTVSAIPGPWQEKIKDTFRTIQYQYYEPTLEKAVKEGDLYTIRKLITLKKIIIPVDKRKWLESISSCETVGFEWARLKDEYEGTLEARKRKLLQGLFDGRKGKVGAEQKAEVQEANQAIQNSFEPLTKLISFETIVHLFQDSKELSNLMTLKEQSVFCRGVHRKVTEGNYSREEGNAKIEAFYRNFDKFLIQMTPAKSWWQCYFDKTQEQKNIELEKKSIGPITYLDKNLNKQTFTLFQDNKIDYDAHLNGEAATEIIFSNLLREPALYEGELQGAGETTRIIFSALLNEFDLYKNNALIRSKIKKEDKKAFQQFLREKWLKKLKNKESSCYCTARDFVIFRSQLTDDNKLQLCFHDFMKQGDSFRNSYQER
jgi:hypothetical protein